MVILGYTLGSDGSSGFGVVVVRGAMSQWSACSDELAVEARGEVQDACDGDSIGETRGASL